MEQHTVVLKVQAEIDQGYGTRLAFAPDGGSWASARVSLLQLWQGRELQTSVRLPGPVQGLGYSDDGRYVLASPYLYDRRTAQVVELPPLEPRLADGIPSDRWRGRAGEFAVGAAAWSPDATLLLLSAIFAPIAGPPDGSSYSGPAARLLLFEGQSRRLQRVLWEGELFDQPSVLAVQGKARRLAVAGLDIRTWANPAAPGPQRLAAHTAGVRDLRFSNDGTKLVSAGADGLVVLWDLKGEPRQQAGWTAHAGGATAAAFHPHLPLLVTGGSDGCLKVWHLDPAGRATLAGQDCRGPVEALALSPAGDKLVVAVQSAAPRLILYSLAADR